ncbi:MAG TPA: UDP-N-acetylglucosamine 2-epimerase (non-hydrolyzing) [Parafilimonas sp.]|nr:UDP-N-acetylglucosamine 2-epimerase (non-hydrolyzing) [Parafilimonas sp.]
MLIDIIAGARPNFMKIAPVSESIKQAQKKGFDIQYRLIHTGQHFDKNMSGSFFEELEIPEPEINLEAGGGTQAEQTAAIMIRYEKVLMGKKPDLVLVVGDVTSTMACSITAKKMNNIRVAHVEAGIRSGDLTMPEEINRMVTDCITDYFFTTSETANENLRKAGIENNRIFFVGNTMIDTLYKQMPRLKQPSIWKPAALKEKNYLVLTLHRPSNVDDAKNLRLLIENIIEASRNIPIIFPVHPRTKKLLQHLNIKAGNLHLTEPLGYLEFNYLVKNSKAVITDSGGITEETTVMNIPCITLRNTTERPETCTIGTNELIGTIPSAIKPVLNKLFANKWKTGKIPPLWDGKAAERIVDNLLAIFGLKKQECPA